MIRVKSTSNRAGYIVGAFALAVLAAGCATTQQAKVSDQSVQAACVFLGNSVCSQLTPANAPGRFSGAAITGDGEGVPGWRYTNPNAQWTQYSKVLIAPVTFWAGEDTKASPADQDRLTDYFYQALETQLSTKFQVVQQAGPGVMTIQVAILDSEAATPVLRTISMAIPQMRGLTTLTYVATGTYAFIGGATAEVKILDSVTHQVLEAAVDKRVGSGHIKTAAQWQWGDAENAMTDWAQVLTNELSSRTSGAAPS